MKKPAAFRRATALLCILFSLNLFGQAPANDECSTAITLTAATPVAGTVWNATASSSIPVDLATGNPDDDVWYKFVATSTTASISLSGIGSGLNTTGAMLQLFSGACGSLVSSAYGNGVVAPLLASSLTNGNTYYVRVYSYSAGALSSSGASAFTITFTNSIVPSNDEWANAIVLPTSNSCLNSTGWLQGATTSTSLTNCTGTVKYDVWYQFIATQSSPTITLSSLGSNISGNVRLQLFSSALGSLFCGTTSISSSGLTVGGTYYIRVYSNTTNASTFTSNAGFNICVTNAGSPIVIDSTTTLFNIDTVARNLGYPWEITYGPDDSLWITEARGYRVLRISSTRTQAKIAVAPQQVLKLPLGTSGTTGTTFTRAVGTWPQGGMEGLVIHPEFKTSPAKQWVYIAYVYAGTCPSFPWPPPSNSPCYFRSKIVRCQFYYAADAGNPTSLPHRDTLVILDTVLSNLPGSNDHNSGRLTISPVKEGSGTPTYKLYYTIGDMGAGQFNNDLRTNNAQNKDTCEGKILRLNTEPDGDASLGVTHDYNTWRQWIPNDNPFTHSINGLRTPIYSYGHRNAQGLAWGNVSGTWRLYESEHGDRTGDEVNVIQAGMNYGWPKVTGMADNNYTTYDDITNGFTENNILANQSIRDETTFSANTTNFTRPVFDFFNWNSAELQSLDEGDTFTWPTIAPSSIDFYNGGIPGWKNSLLVTSLKYGMYRLKLKSTGDYVDSTSSANAVDTFPLLHGWRVRDIAINPLATSGQFWAITDSSGSTSGPTGGFSAGISTGTKNGGRVLRLTYKTLITLPTKYISFTGKLLSDQTIRVDWEAETDQNHSYFEVEKSINNIAFRQIGTVGIGAPYTLIDPLPNVGNNYYRLRQVNKDGSWTYSKVINVIYDPSFYTVTAYPNPVKNVLTIKVTSPITDKIRIELTDIQGRIVYKQNTVINNGTSEIKIDVKTWSPQLYSLKITGSDNTILTTQKIMKL